MHSHKSFLYKSIERATQFDMVLTEKESGGGVVYVYLCGREPHSGEIHGSDEILPGVLVDYRKDQSIVGVEFLTSGIVGRIEEDDLDLTSRVDGRVTLYLNRRGPEVTRLRYTKDENVMAGICEDGKLCSLDFAPPKSKD